MEYLQRIKDALKNKTDVSNLNENTKFKELNIDSLDLVDLVMELEEEVNVEFSDEELLSITTVGDLLRLLDSKK